MAFFFTKIVRNIIFFILALNGIQYFLKWKSYNVSVKDFKTLSSKSADTNALNAASKFTSEIRRRYPGHIAQDPHWVPLSAGGMHMKVQFLLADVTEYVALWSAIGDTSGRSGFHWVNSSCTVLTGEVGRMADSYNSAQRENFGPGQNFRHAQYESYAYFMKDGTLVACYGRGFIPLSTFWTSAGALSQGDPVSAAKFAYAYGRLMFDGVSRNVAQTYEYAKNKVTKMEL